MKKYIFAFCTLSALLFSTGPHAFFVAHAQEGPSGVSYVEKILDIPRLNEFGGYTSEGGSFVGGVVYLTDVEWMPGYDGEGYFVVTTSVAEQLGANAYKFGLWVFSDEGEELAQINIEEVAGNTRTDTGHLAAKNLEVRELGDDHIIIETYVYEENFSGSEGLFIYRIGGFSGATLVASKGLPGGYGGLGPSVTYYTDDYLLAPSGGSTNNSQHVLYDALSLERRVTYSSNPFTQGGKTRYVRAPSIGNYVFVSRRDDQGENGGLEIGEAYQFTSQGIEEVAFDFSGDAFVWPDFVAEDTKTDGKWIITGRESVRANAGDRLLLLTPGDDELVIEKEFSLKSGVFGETLFPSDIDRRVGGFGAAGDYLVFAMWDNDGTGDFDVGFGTNRVFVFNYETEELVFSGVLDKHVLGGSAIGVPHPATGVPLTLHPNRVNQIIEATVSPNGMLAVGSREQVYLYQLEDFDGTASGGGGGGGSSTTGDDGAGGPLQGAPTFDALYEFTTLYIQLLQDLMRGTINPDTARNATTRTQDGGSRSGGSSLDRLFEFLRF